MQREQLMGTMKSNLLIAIRAVEAQQKVAKNPLVWQSLEDDLIDLKERVEKLEHGTT
jgi:hypothetical protein